MATKIIVSNTEYFSQLKNGDTFSLNTSDFSDHLLGNLMAKMQFKTTVQLSNRFNMGAFEISGGDTITLSTGNSFLDEDFYTGGIANLTFENNPISFSFDITSISSDGSIMVVSNVIGVDNSGSPVGPASLPDGTHGDGGEIHVMRDLSPSEGLICKFNFIANDATTSYISAIDQIEQGYKFAGIRTASPTPVTGEWNDEIKGSNTGGMTAEFIGDVLDNGVNKNGGSGGANSCPLPSIQEFEIVQEFILNAYYLQGELDNLKDSIAPERLKSKSLKHVIEFEFRKNLSNPNTSKFGVYDSVLGNTNYTPN